MINPKKSYTIEEYIEILRKRIWYIIIPFILIFSAAYVYTIVAPRLYKATTLVLVSPQSIPQDYVRATVTSKVEERLQSIAQDVLSRTRLERIITELNIYQQERGKMPMEQVVSLMQEDIEIELPTKREDKGYFTITYIGKDPTTVTTVANRLSSQFIEENLKLREQQAQSTTEFLSVELASAKTKLEEMETAVTQYKRKYMGELPEQRDSNLKILEQLQNQYQRISENMRYAKDRKLFLQKQLSDMLMGTQEATKKETVGFPSSASPMREGAREETMVKKSYYESEKEALTRTLEELRVRYTENHPDVIAAIKRLEDFEKNKTLKEAYSIENDPTYKELNNQLTFTNMEIARLGDDERGIKAQIEKYRQRIEQTPVREQEMTSLLREYESTKDTYERLLKKSQDAQQAENLEKRQKGERFKVIDPARTPEKPFSPDIPKILLIGFFLAVGGGLGTAFFREQMDRSFHDPGDVEMTLGLKVLANIPKIEQNAA